MSGYFYFFVDLLYLSLTCTHVLDSSGLKKKKKKTHTHTNFLLNKSQWAHLCGGFQQVRCHSARVCVYVSLCWRLGGGRWGELGVVGRVVNIDFLFLSLFSSGCKSLSLKR